MPLEESQIYDMIFTPFGGDYSSYGQKGGEHSFFDYTPPAAATPSDAGALSPMSAAPTGASPMGEAGPMALSPSSPSLYGGSGADNLDPTNDNQVALNIQTPDETGRPGFGSGRVDAPSDDNAFSSFAQDVGSQLGVSKSAIGTGIGGALGSLAGPLGSIAGGAIGGHATGATRGQTAGHVAGGVLGGFFGGPLGSFVGSMIGKAFGGWLGGEDEGEGAPTGKDMTTPGIPALANPYSRYRTGPTAPGPSGPGIGMSQDIGVVGPAGLTSGQAASLGIGQAAVGAGASTGTDTGHDADIDVDVGWGGF